MDTTEYRRVTERDVPTNLIWVTPRRNQGQIVEVSFSNGIPAGRRVNYEADDGDPWMRSVDRSDNTVRFYRATTAE